MTKILTPQNLRVWRR